MSSTVFLVFFIIVSSSASVLLENNDPKKSIIWPTEFYFNAEEMDYVNSLIVPSEVWYSAKNNRSRIDYYNGTNTEYYVAQSDYDMGYQYTIFPITTELVKNKKVCLKEMRTGIQPDFLPNKGDYQYSHEIQEDGKQVRVWTTDSKLKDDRWILSILYVYRTDYDFDVPLKHVNKIINFKKGCLTSHTVKNFKQFAFSIDIKKVTLEDGACTEAMHTDFKTQIEQLHPQNPIHVNVAFHSYKKHHNKTYKKTEQELRKAIFFRNWRRIHDHNRKNLSFKMELNAFADRTEDELKALTGTQPSDPTARGSMPFPHSDEELMELAKKLPESYDLRLQGVLGPVKSQGKCGSCWAFATTATVEAALSKGNGGRNLVLSEQSLIDCSWGLKYNNKGCYRGQLLHTYFYITEHGIPLESQYGEYIAKNGYCNLDNTTKTFKIRDFVILPPGNPDALKIVLVNYGPVAVTIHASRNMKDYSSGVFYDIKCEGEKPNHGVVVVGYGERDGTPYWVVRNSWGETWGQDGYILMSAGNNTCMNLDRSFFPIV